jgi:hypothetical protein
MELIFVSTPTDKHENVGDGDLYSVRPGVIKEGHMGA